MARIKFTGYLDESDAEHFQLDPADPSGLSPRGLDDFTGPDSMLTVGSLEDLEVERELS